jgi:hypothetical protein
MVSASDRSRLVAESLMASRDCCCFCCCSMVNVEPAGGLRFAGMMASGEVDGALGGELFISAVWRCRNSPSYVSGTVPLVILWRYQNPRLPFSCCSMAKLRTLGDPI